MRNKNRILLIFHANVQKRRQQIAQQPGSVPMADYLALIDALEADYIDQTTVDAKLWSRWLKKLVGYEVVLALLAYFRRNRYDLFYGDSEAIGMPLAFLFKYTRQRRRLMFIAHRLTRFSRTIFLDYFRIQHHVDTVFVHTLAQETVALARCGFTAQQVELIPYQVDPAFWNMEAYIEQLAREKRNRPIHDQPYICSAGMECRDYATLLKAIEGLDIELRLAVGSHYSQSKETGLSEELPPNVKVKFYNYTELRELYANSAFVVMPTYDVDHSAGVTSIMEAMGLGKAVIATRSVGQSDVVNDRRTTTRSNFNRMANATFSKIYAPNHLSNLQTGMYVNPGQADEMRQAIEHLLANPAKAAEIGENARRLIEASLTLNHFCERIKDEMVDHLSLPLKGVPVPG